MISGFILVCCVLCLALLLVFRRHRCVKSNDIPADDWLFTVGDKQCVFVVSVVVVVVDIVAIVKVVVVVVGQMTVFCSFFSRYKSC